VDVVRGGFGGWIAAPALALVAACTAAEGDVLTTVAADAALVDGSGVSPDGATGDATECDNPRPVPPMGDVTICGRLLDLETTAPVTSAAPEVRVFDLAELRDNPVGAVELALVEPDECGWFYTTIDAVAGWTVVHTGDVTGIGGGYRRVTTLVPTLMPGQKVEVNAFVLRAATDDDWSSDAGLVAATFADFGAVLAIYVDITETPMWPFQGAPVSGVTMLADGGTHAADDFYFSDSDALARSNIAPAQATTGANGAGLMRGTVVLTTYSGQRAGCSFNEAQGLPIPTAVQVQEIAGTCN
jgi:hypothetical protein